MTFDDYRSEAEVGFYIPLYGFDVDATEELNLEGGIWCIFQHEAGSLTLFTRVAHFLRNARMWATESEECTETILIDEIQRYSAT